MAQQDFTVEFEFTSTRAMADNYTRTRVVKADNETAALNVARLVGFSEFGASFTDNCVDWRIKAPAH